jgi:GTP-binding protein Era
MEKHKSGYVNILGKPNAGKSTLLNALVNASLSITNKKAQTTRRRIIGIYSDEMHQIVFSDTPGIIEQPSYRMQEKMNAYIYQTFEDADIVLYVADINDPQPWNPEISKIINQSNLPKILIINKQDTLPNQNSADTIKNWPYPVSWDQIYLISATDPEQTKPIIEYLLNHLPEGPVYYPKDELSDQNERFFVSEIIRNGILELYSKEIPYSCEVVIESFTESDKDGKSFAHIGATIYTNRQSQKPIIIGKNGSMIKKLGILSRGHIEAFLDYPVYLELHVKVRENWRDDENMLNRFGY